MKLDRDKAAGRQKARPVEAAKHIDSIVRGLSESIEMAPVLPFLKERISLKIPSDIAFLDRVLEYLNERLLRLGIAGPDDT
ncbi:MAG TPA: hypothetical protein VI756_33035, partial [Blastocatellia bacterium]